MTRTPKPVLVMQASPLGDLVVPTVDGPAFLARRGVAVEVPADVAGAAPGPWTALVDGEMPALDDGRSWSCEDGAWSVRDPGRGLLAQEDIWTLAVEPATTEPKD